MTLIGRGEMVRGVGFCGGGMPTHLHCIVELGTHWSRN
jgi:hypothetical protein